MKHLQQQQDAQLGLHQPPTSYQVRLIQHSERYADLRYHVLNASAPQHRLPALEAAGVAPDSDTGQLTKMHPCAVLSARQIQQDGFPSEISLEPCDCLELYHAMCITHQAANQVSLSQHQASVPVKAVSASTEKTPDSAETAPAEVHDFDMAGDSDSQLPHDHGPTAVNSMDMQQWAAACNTALDSLSPDKYFSGQQQISRTAVRVWETKLKAALVSWASMHGPAGLLATKRVLSQLRPTVKALANSPLTRANSPSEFHQMLRMLDERGMLPMLTFSFERRKCENLAGKLQGAQDCVKMAVIVASFLLSSDG